MLNINQTVISQYANSPTLLSLIDSINNYLDPTADIDNLYSYIWDIDTAQGFGLDILGRVVGVGRALEITTGTWFGFTQGGGQPFNQAPFYSTAQGTSTYSLSDTAYRTLIKAKALANISGCVIPVYNKLLQILFEGRGGCYLTVPSPRLIQFTFEFSLYDYEISIMRSNVLPVPTGTAAQMSILGSVTALT